MPRKPRFLLLIIFSGVVLGQMEISGNIAGQIQIAPGGAPSRPILVELRLRGATMDTTYSGVQGAFSFGNLPAESYRKPSVTRPMTRSTCPPRYILKRRTPDCRSFSTH